LDIQVMVGKLKTWLATEFEAWLGSDIYAKPQVEVALVGEAIESQSAQIVW
jgi:hypothetical protein